MALGISSQLKKLAKLKKEEEDAGSGFLLQQQVFPSYLQLMLLHHH